MNSRKVVATILDRIRCTASVAVRQILGFSRFKRYRAGRMALEEGGKPLPPRRSPQQVCLADVFYGKHARQLAVVNHGKGSQPALPQKLIPFFEEVGAGCERRELRLHNVAHVSEPVR